MKRRLDFTSKLLGPWVNYAIELMLWVTVLLVCGVIYEFAVRPVIGQLALFGVIGWTAIVSASLAALPAWVYTEWRWRKLSGKYKAKLDEFKGNRVSASDMAALLITRGEYVVKHDLVNDLIAHYAWNDREFNAEEFARACGRR